jgi:hypothetical protein
VCLAAITLALVASAPVEAQESLPAEAVVATVGGPTPAPGVDVVLLSDVTLRARIELALVGRSEAVPLTPALLSATLEQIVGELLVAREAQRLGTAEPTSEDVERERARLESTLGGAEAAAVFLRAEDATMAELDAIAARRAHVTAFFRANLEGSGEISDAQVEARYALGDHPFVGRLLEEVREPLRAWMASESVRADVARWLEVLRGRSVVRIFLSALERAAPPEETAGRGPTAGAW